jgi:ATP-dependent DNA ligase
VLAPRKTRFGSPLVLSRVHWVELKHVAEITYLTWTADNLLRQTVYVGMREDKPAEQAARGVKAAAGDPRLKRWLTLHGNAQDSASVNG